MHKGCANTCTLRATSSCAPYLHLFLFDYTFFFPRMFALTHYLNQMHPLRNNELLNSAFVESDSSVMQDAVMQMLHSSLALFRWWKKICSS